MAKSSSAISIAYGSSLQRAAAFVDFVQVIAEDSSIGHFRAWRETFRHGDKTAGASFTGQPIHIIWTGVLQYS